MFVLLILSNAAPDEELPAGPSNEHPDLARARGYCDECDIEVTTHLDSVEAARAAFSDLPSSATATLKKQLEEGLV